MLKLLNIDLDGFGIIAHFQAAQFAKITQTGTFVSNLLDKNSKLLYELREEYSNGVPLEELKERFIGRDASIIL
tara:strand:- start:731 stop:952 length:222 start_codon:yes stop_codon:yes gene_type:complete